MTTMNDTEDRAQTAARDAWLAAREVHDLAMEAARLAGEVYRQRPTTLAWEAWHAATVTWERTRVGEARARRVIETRARCPLIGIRSTELRRRVAAGSSIRYLTPAAVERYIAAHRLYQPAG